MFFKQFYDEKLSQTSYMIACQQTKDAIIIDPSRVLDEYEEVAYKQGYNISYAAETHIHADFASGLRDAARKFGSRLFVSDEGDDNWKYENMPENTVFLKEGDTIEVGNVELKVMHTPGHTPESITFILTDHGGGSEEPMGMFTGDFLFVGDIGRPDLLEEAAKMKGTTELGAKEMFNSLKKLENYPDFLQIWPGHGAGSPCGKALGAVPLSTLGYERQNNWALKAENEESFVKELVSDQPEPPTHFAHMKKVNKEGLPEFKVKEVDVGTPEQLPGQIFDLRSKETFSEGFIKGSINIPFNDKFLRFAGWYVDFNRPMTLIADPENSEQLQKDFASIGFDDIALIVPEDKVEQYAVASYENVQPAELTADYEDKNILDVRSKSEYRKENLKNAKHLHFGQLTSEDKEIPFDKEDNIYVHCQSGVRSAIAASVLKAEGYENIINVRKGYNGIKNELQT
ncbi:MBL fold metallo-hydrolase [Lacicoccus qingdaonensis]|uniref:Glyoxylase, beta-lactamase superfamily II n=1 Tax=Lacicoccus qingdaonensis TaxID=576118 RepID=A0A1G9BK41_9BACL|nr:MBL fold metallo-hydrolase [Salinicoccus qingdaonensis]SDK39888.1 Glyoxylase, beta-lactamase superfamily II [Salinicoccus qingdaonensis]